MVTLEPFADSLHAEKYRGKNEGFRDAVNRWANALHDDPEHFKALQDIFGNQRFLMGGRCQSAIGSPRKVTAYNCFVSRTIRDTLFGRGGIVDSSREALQTMQMGGGIGFDFSTLRPGGDRVKSIDTEASGPVSAMEIFNTGCLYIKSAGHRRGALMAVLRIDHPDIMEFVKCKTNRDRLTGFNISVGVTDEFMKAVEDDGMFKLKFRNRVYSEIWARPLWDIIMQNAYDWSEPGVIFLDRINEMNNLSYCEHIATTNPCGEQPLSPYAACLLGSFNLVKYLTGCFIDTDKIVEDIPHVVRAMDNIVDESSYPLQEQEEEAKNKRRMGLGVTGLANAVEACGVEYGSESFVNVTENTMKVLRDECYRASIELAKEKGPFPLFDKDKYLAGKFIQTLPIDIREGIAEHGIRNSHLLSIAPTGTISMCANNVSSGIEPVIRYKATRTIQTFDGPTQVDVEDYGVKFLGVRGKRAQDCSIDDHLNVQILCQKYVDSAVSKTINFRPSTGGEDFYEKDFQDMYSKAFKGGLKGITCHNEEGKRAGLFSEEIVQPEEGQACGINPETGRQECS